MSSKYKAGDRVVFLVDISLPTRKDKPDNIAFKKGDICDVDDVNADAQCVLIMGLWVNYDDVEVTTEKRDVQDKKPTNPKDIAAATRLDLSVFPDTATIFGALGMTEGGYKYGAYNYREKGILASVYYASARRHMMKYFAGEWEDPKTKVPHLGSALSCIAILIDGHVMGNLVDDRPPHVDMQKLLDSMEANVKHLQDIFPEPKPRCTAK